MTSRNKARQRCRTCLDTTDKNFHSLDGKLVKDNQRKTLADFLWDTCKLENDSEAKKCLPQHICGNCLRKLKITFSFVMQVEEVNRKIMANLHTSKKSITVPEEYFDESNEMDVDKHSVCQPRECFIEFNNSLVQFHEDPIATSKTTNKKVIINRYFKSETSSYGQRNNSNPVLIDDNAENRKHSIFCKNDRHKEMKSMLQDFMDMQKQMNARFKDVGIYTDRNVSNEISKFTQTKPDIEEMAILRLANHNNHEDIERIETVRSWFPISTIEQALEVENQIKKHVYSIDFITYLKRNQNSTVDDILRSIFKDELTNQYNLDGRSGKMSLLSLDAILKCVQSVFSDLPEKKFFKLVRRYILLCHNRLNQKKYWLKKKQTFAKAMRHHDIDLENITYEYVENPVMENAVEIEIGNGSEQTSNESFECSNQQQNLYHENMRANIRKSPMDFEQNAIRKRTSFSRRVGKLKRHKETFIDSKVSAGNYVVKLPKGSGDTSSSRISQQRIELTETTTTTNYLLSTLFPLQAQDQLTEIGLNIVDTDYADEICAYLHMLKGSNGNVDNVLCKVFTDDLIAKYNFDGLQGRHCLRHLHLISDCLFYVFSEITSMEFLKHVRRYVTMSHYRTKNRRTKAKSSLLPTS